MNIIWFRRDLRLEDNTALKEFFLIMITNLTRLKEMKKSPNY